MSRFAGYSIKNMRKGRCEHQKKSKGMNSKENGVTDGDRTRDNRNHNPGLYQLSYGHHNVKRRIMNWYAQQDSNLQPSP